MIRPRPEPYPGSPLEIPLHADLDLLTHFAASLRGPVSIQTTIAVSSNPPSENDDPLALTWKVQGFLYIKSDDLTIMYQGSGEPILTFDAGYIIASNFDGTYKSTLPDRNMFGFGTMDP